MAKVPFGGMFVAEDVGTEQKRFDAREIVTAGPIFGRKTFPAAHEAAQREAATLEAFGVRKENFGGFGKLVQGTRRHNFVYLDDFAAEQRGGRPALDVHIAGGELRDGFVTRDHEEGNSRRESYSGPQER